MDKIPIRLWILLGIFILGTLVGFCWQAVYPLNYVPGPSEPSRPPILHSVKIEDFHIPQFNEGKLVSVITAAIIEYHRDGPIELTNPRAWHYGEGTISYMEGDHGEIEIKDGVMQVDALRVWGNTRMRVKEKGNGLHDRSKARQRKDGGLVLEPEGEERQGAGN